MTALPERKAGPDPLGHYEVPFRDEIIAFPGWNTPRSIIRVIDEWTGQVTHTAAGSIPYKGYSHTGYRTPPILVGTPLTALEARGFRLAVATQVDASHLGIDDHGFDILCWAYDVTAHLEDRKAVLRSAVDLRARLVTAMCNVRRAVNADMEASDGPARWSGFASRVAAALTPEARAALEEDVADYRTDQARGRAKDSFVRNLPAPGVPQALSARFKVTRRGEVRAKVLLPGFTLSGRSMHVKGSFPRAYVDALAGRDAREVVDHPWTRGREIRHAVADRLGIVATLAA